MTTRSRADRVIGGRVLLPGAAEPAPADVGWNGGSISEVAATADARTEAVIDARDALVLPGIVDLHSDAFERSVMPRPGVWVDLDAALADNDIQLLASGITTAFLSATDSWEPGLRSRATLIGLVDAMARRPRAPDVRLHIRHERCNTDAVEELEELIRSRDVGLLSFNDHTPGGTRIATDLTMTQIQRSGCGRDELSRQRDLAIGRRRLGLEQEDHLSQVARSAGCPLASHDPELEEDLERDLQLGISIAEFPTSLTLATRYIEAGVDVLLGAPNLVRGGSHLGNLSVRDAFHAGAATVLCSDYHYPSLLAAPFVAAEVGTMNFGAAWTAVSEAPARAVGLADRGRIAVGARADIVVVEPPNTGPARVRAVIVGGEVAYHAP